MKGSDSIVLQPGRFKRVSCEDEQKQSPTRVLGGGGGNRERKLELGRSVSSSNLDRDLNWIPRRRATGIKDVDRPLPTTRAHLSADSGREKPTGRLSRYFITGSSATRDLRRKLGSTSYLSERLRGLDRSRESDKDSSSRRTSAPASTLAVLPSEDNNKSFPLKSAHKLGKPYELSNSLQARKPKFKETGYSNTGEADTSEYPSADSPPQILRKSRAGAIGDNSRDNYCKRGIISGDSNNDTSSSSCSSSDSNSPRSLNSRLIKMQLQAKQTRRSSASDDKLLVASDRKSVQSGAFNRGFSMGSNSGMHKSRPGRDVPGLVGLINEGNTCYLNSCLQCLAHSMPLASAVQNAVDSLVQRRGSGTRASSSGRDLSNLAQPLAYSFRQVVRDLRQSPAFSATSARMFLHCVQAWAPQFAGHSQHDAQEVLRAILDGLHEALNRVATAPPYRDLYLEPKPEEELAELTWRYHKLCQDSLIQDIFCGQLQSTIECCTCHRKSHCFDPFHDLSLPLPKSERESRIRDHSFRGTNPQSRVTLHDCLSAFVAPEQLEGSNKYYCPSCKRFYKTERFLYQKDDTPVYYPLQGLDFTDFLSSKARRVGRPGVIYDLYGVCCHMGSLGCGHYTAQCKNCENNAWYCFNDSSVTPLQEAAVLSSSAYILFYQQQP